MKASKNKLLYRPLNLKRFMKQIFTGLAFCLGLSLSTVQAQNGVFNVNLDTIFQTANSLNGGSMNVTFEGVDRTITHGLFTAHAQADSSNGGPKIIPNFVDNSNIVTCNLGYLANTAGVKGVRFLGFTLSGVQADLDNITTESLNFRSSDEDQSFDVAANTLQIGFNSVPRTTLTDNFFASSASFDRMGTIQLTLNKNGAGNISSDLRITSLRFELSSVPEPQSYALFAAALAGFAVYFRKNKIKA